MCLAVLHLEGSCLSPWEMSAGFLRALGSFSVQLGTVECPALQSQAVLFLIPQGRSSMEMKSALKSCVAFHVALSSHQYLELE